MELNTQDIDRYEELKKAEMMVVYRDPMGELKVGLRQYEPNGKKTVSTVPIEAEDMDQYRKSVIEGHAKRLASIDLLIADIKALPAPKAE